MSGRKPQDAAAAKPAAVAKAAPAIIAEVAPAVIAGDTAAESAPALAAGPTTSPADATQAAPIETVVQSTTAATAQAPALDQELVTEPYMVVRVTAKQPERRRAGFKFTSAPETVSLGKDDLSRLHSLVADTLLIVEAEVGPDEWMVLKPTDLPPLPDAAADDDDD